MAVIPRYDAQVSTNPLANKRQTAMMTPGAMGSGIGDAAQRVAQGLADVAEVMDYREQLTAKADADNAYNQYMEHRRQVLYDENTGYLNQTGRNALGGSREAAMEELQKRRAAVEGGLSPRALNDFKRRADAVDNQVADAAIKHSANQQKTYTNESLNAAYAASLEAAGLAYNDEEASNTYLDEARKALYDHAALNGTPPAALEAAERKLISDVNLQRAQNIAFEDPIVADQFLDSKQDEIDPNAYREMKETLKPLVRRRQADQRISAMFAPNGAASAPVRSEAAVAQGGALLAKAGTMFMSDEVEHNEALRQYMADGGVNLDPAKTAWCAAFVNATLGHVGLKGTSSNMARSFLEWGVDSSDNPMPGDIVVLERGEPPFGHVGIVTGFTASGDPIILGGNQNDAVSVKTYSSQKVLGYRRAGVPQGGSGPRSNDALANDLSSIMAIADIDLRNDTLAAFQQRVEVQEMQERLRREQMMDQGWEGIVNGQNPDNLPVETQIAIGSGGMASLRQAHAAHTTGSDIHNPATYQHLLDQSLASDLTTLKEFADTNLNDFAGELSEAKLTELKVTQAEVREHVREQEVGGRPADKVYELPDFGKAADEFEEQFAMAMGNKFPGTSANAATNTAWNRFRGQLRQAMEVYANEHNAPMPPSELQKTAGALLLPVRIDDAVMLGDTQTILAEAPHRAMGHDVDVVMEPTDVPYSDRDRITSYLAQSWSRPPTEEEVVDHYEREVLHSVGLRPELEFEDIPRDIRRNLKRQQPEASDEQIIDLYLDMMVGASRQ